MEVLALLNSLALEESNNVCVVSGRSRTELGEWLKSVPNLGLAAEHGCFFRPNGKTEWRAAQG